MRVSTLGGGKSHAGGGDGTGGAGRVWGKAY